MMLTTVMPNRATARTFDTIIRAKARPMIELSRNEAIVTCTVTTAPLRRMGRKSRAFWRNMGNVRECESGKRARTGRVRIDGQSRCHLSMIAARVPSALMLAMPWLTRLSMSLSPWRRMMHTSPLICGV